MKDSPKNHKWVLTEDGSYTLFSEAFQEACHSTSGAKEETILHYIKGCQVHEKLISQNDLTILEVGFGLGLGFLTTLEEIKKYEKPVHFLSLEIDPELLNWFQEQYPQMQWHQGEFNYLEGIFGKIKLTVLCGDARKSLPWFAKNYPFKVHAIYQDAFSPKKNPVLWSVEWFEFLKTISAEDVTLSTYSSSSSIRKSLIQAGWTLQKGEKFGPKRSSTRASLQGISDPEILEQLARSPVEALTDESIGLK